MIDRPHIATLNPAPAHADPASACVSWSWICDVLKPLGMTVLAIEYKPDPHQALPWMDDSIGTKLEDAQWGQFDSYRIGDPVFYFFVVYVDRLAGALQLVFKEIAAAGAAQRCRVAHADATERVWRTAAVEAGGAK